jgi:hypothetical protein
MKLAPNSATPHIAQLPACAQWYIRQRRAKNAPPQAHKIGFNRSGISVKRAQDVPASDCQAHAAGGQLDLLKNARFGDAAATFGPLAKPTQLDTSSMAKPSSFLTVSGLEVLPRARITPPGQRKAAAIIDIRHAEPEPRCLLPVGL